MERTESSESGSIYSRLASDEIRLLKLKPDIRRDKILEGELHTFILWTGDGLPPEEPETRQGRKIQYTNGNNYEALSYYWGTEPHSSHIALSDMMEPRKEVGALRIKPNLHLALRTLSKILPKDRDMYFWVDAVCINQQDKDEKSTQIAKMSSIFNLAETVHVWLGPATERSDIAMDFVHELIKLDEIDNISSDPSYDSKWSAFRDLMRSEWFGRRWIIQEIALARTATVYRGEKSISWHEFTYAVSLFVHKAPALKRLFQQSKDFKHNPDYLGELEALGAKVLVDVTNNVVRKTNDGYVLDHLRSLEALMSTLTEFEASTPHDTVYAILSLAYDVVAQSKRPTTALHDSVARTPVPSPRHSSGADKPEFSFLPTESMPTVRLTDTDRLSASPTDIRPSAADSSSQCGKVDSDQAAPKADGSQAPPKTAANQAPLKTDVRQPALKNGSQQAATRNDSQQSGSSQKDANEALLKPPNFPQKARKGSTSVSGLRRAELDVRTRPDAIQVNYDQPFYEVCRDFLQFVILNSRSLDIICQPWAPAEPGLPSWILPLSRKAFGVSHRFNVHSRVAADVLVGSPGNGRIYNACGKVRAYHTEPKGPKLIIGKSLVTKGFILDTIHVVGDQALGGQIPAQWLDLGEWKDVADPPPPRFWRTMVADRDRGGKQPPPAHFPAACQWTFANLFSLPQHYRNVALNLKELLNDMSCPSVVVPFLRRVQEVTWGRRLVRTRSDESEESNGTGSLLALVPTHTKEGDLICILHGCSVPVVLRKKEACGNAALPGASRKRKSSQEAAGLVQKRRKGRHTTRNASASATPSIQSGEEPEPGPEPGPEPLQVMVTSSPGHMEIPPDKQYEFIGECYVDGMMSGEGFTYRDNKGGKDMEFWLV